jgi:hypothetical protein
MDILGAWAIPIRALGSCGIRDILKDGETRVYKCKDEYGNFVVRIEQVMDDGGYQSASVVFGPHEEARANYACIHMLKEQHPFIQPEWTIYVAGSVAA